MDKISLCYFAESNAKVLSTAGAYQKYIAPCRELIRVWENPMRVRIQAVLVMLQIGVEQPERIVYCNLKLHML